MTRRRLLTLGLLAVAAGGVVAAVVSRHGRPPAEAYRDGIEAVERGDAEAAEAALDSLRDAPGFESHRHLLAAALRLRSGDARGSMRDLALVRATGELREPAYLFKGEALYRLGRLGEAEQVLLRLDAVRPDQPDVCRWLAAIYYDLGAMDHAIGRLEQLARVEPGDYAPHRMQGMIHADFERYGQAIDHYREALLRDPPEAERDSISLELARALSRERRYAEAVAALEGVAPEPEALALRAECLWDLGRKDDARRLLTDAKAGKPDLREALLLEARIASDAGRHAEAAAALERAVALDPHDPEARYQLAMTYRSLGRTADFERELARKQESQELRNRLTELNLEAIERPRDAEVRDRLAEVCDRLGRRELAAMWRKAADACRGEPAGGAS